MRAHCTMGRKPRRRTAAVVGLGTTAALVLGACAQEASTPDTVTGGELGDFAATTDYLSGVARAAEEQSFRMAVDMTMRGSSPGEDEFEASGQMMTGEVDGETSSMVLDMGPMMGEIAPGEPIDGDLTMTMVTDGEVLYVQAPLFRTLAETALSEGRRAATSARWPRSRSSTRANGDASSSRASPWPRWHRPPGPRG
jgi:hypothetical protein